MTTDDAPARTRILAAAGALFAEHGFDRTSTAKLAAAAGVPHGLVFYHFPTKVDLLLAVVEAGGLTFTDDTLAPPRPGADPERYVRRMWDALVELIGRPDPVRRVLIQELETHPEVRARATALHEQLTDLIARRLAEAAGVRVGPAHRAGAQLIAVTAGLGPLLGAPVNELVDGAGVARLVVRGIG